MITGDPDKKPACPICGKPEEDKFKPFCSKRCADIDLSRWFKGVYAIPGEDSETPPILPDEKND